MAREKLNTIQPAPKQIWEHIKTEQQVLVLHVEADEAYCAILADNKVTRMRVNIPAKKLMCYGNRGMMHVTNRRGKLPKLGDLAAYGVFNPRNVNLGAVTI